MSISPSEERVLQEFVDCIEAGLIQEQIRNGFRAIRDAILTHATISFGLAHDLNIEPNMKDGADLYGAMRSLIDDERRRT
jgi:hypothetical protein